MNVNWTESLHTAETSVMCAIESVQAVLLGVGKEVARLTEEEARLASNVEPLKASIVALNAERNGLQADVHQSHEDSRKARQAEGLASQDYRAKLTSETQAFIAECNRQKHEAEERRDEAMQAAKAAEKAKADMEKKFQDFKASLVGATSP